MAEVWPGSREEGGTDRWVAECSNRAPGQQAVAVAVAVAVAGAVGVAVAVAVAVVMHSVN